MINISPEVLAENIQNQRAEGMTLDEIESFAMEEGISPEEFEKALLLIRKFRIHEREIKVVKSSINIIWIILFLISVFVILFFIFTYKDAVLEKLFSEKNKQKIESTEELDKLAYKTDPNYLVMTEEEKKSFDKGDYDKSALEKPKKVNKKILNDFELTIRDVNDISKKEWEVLLKSIINIPTISLNNNEIYIFKSPKNGIWNGFWIYKNKAILAQPFTEKFSDFIRKKEMHHILQNYPSDLVKNDLFFIDQFEIFLEMSEKKISGILKQREEISEVLDNMINTMKFGYFVNYIKVNKNKKTENLEGFTINLEKQNEFEKLNIYIRTLEFVSEKQNTNTLLEDMKKSVYKKRLGRQMVIDSGGRVTWVSGNYLLEIDNNFEDFVLAFLQKYPSDLR